MQSSSAPDVQVDDRLLSADDPSPVVLGGDPTALVLSVEHAGRAVPASLKGLGLSDEEIDRHIGWDPGAHPLAEALAARIGARIVAQPYSRLVIDCNRPREAADLIPEVADGTPVPGNRGLTPEDREARWNAIHQPFHAALASALQGARALVAVHSYDPQRRGDPAPRPWPVGLLWRQANPLADSLAAALDGIAAVQPLGLNQPYGITDDEDYTLPVHAEPRALPHVLIEVRNDLLCDPGGIAAMADLLSPALEAAIP